MALVVVVPGPGHPVPDSSASDTRSGRGLLPQQRVAASLASSVRAVRGRVPPPDRISVLGFDDLFEQAGSRAPDRSDRPPELAGELLFGWWLAETRIGRRDGAAAADPAPPDPARLVRELSASAFFRDAAGSPELEAEALSRYLTDLKLRHRIRDRVQAAILPTTRVVIGHGMGALAAYEALCVLGDTVCVTFVTLGAPLCGPEPVFARLEPPPRHRQGHWPPSVRRWFNIVADCDPTALTAPALTERFGPGIEDEIVEVKSTCGDVYQYLLDRATGRAVAAGLG